jgi:metal-responsive CopG/Arc/MetJ family transcriptional regulator
VGATNPVSMTMTTMKVGITLPIPLLERVETLRGDIPRSTYIQRALQDIIKKGQLRN